MLEIYQEQEQNPTRDNSQITVIKLVGEMDGSNFREAIARTEEICAAGANDLLIDLSGMRFMSSAGLAALHHIAVLMRKKHGSGDDGRWKSLDDLKMEAGSADSQEKHVKLLNPQPRVLNSLEQIGYDRIFEIFADRQAALAAFH